MKAYSKERRQNYSSVTLIQIEFLFRCKPKQNNRKRKYAPYVWKIWVMERQSWTAVTTLFVTGALRNGWIVTGPKSSALSVKKMSPRSLNQAWMEVLRLRRSLPSLCLSPTMILKKNLSLVKDVNYLFI